MRAICTLFFLTLLLSTLSPLALAQYFPLPQTTGDTTAAEGTAPFLTPAGVKQSLITDRNTLNGQGLPATFGVWDMVGFDETSRYIFIPSEVSSGAGLFRYDSQNGSFVTLMQGNSTGVREADPLAWDVSNDDFSRLDPATFTPFGTVITAEETTGGRLFEVLNPKSSGTPNIVWRTSIPAVAHEGLRFDNSGALYFVDENNSGCIYKFVPAVAGDLGVGQTFVLSVDAYAANPNTDPSENWNHSSNVLSNRFGAATWVPITDAMGVALTVANPFAYVTTTGGRAAADEVKGTPYGRPEDLAVGRLANDNEVLYASITSENVVLSIELVSDTSAIVRSFVNYDTINEATGVDVNPTQNFPTVSPGSDSATNFDDPDNLAIDAWGNIYIVEDEGPGDIWRATDADGDGVAESMGIFVSLGVAGSEPTGLIADPNDPYRFIVGVQHPSSGNDALWQLDTRPFPGTNDPFVMESAINGVPEIGPGLAIKPAGPLDSINVRLHSTDGVMALSPVIFFYDLFSTGSPPASPAGAPFLHVDLSTTVVVLDGRAPSIFAPILPVQGLYLSAKVPFGLAGFSVMMQGGVFNNTAINGIAAISDGHEIQLQN